MTTIEELNYAVTELVSAMDKIHERIKSIEREQRAIRDQWEHDNVGSTGPAQMIELAQVVGRVRPIDAPLDCPRVYSGVGDPVCWTCRVKADCPFKAAPVVAEPYLCRGCKHSGIVKDEFPCTGCNRILSDQYEPAASPADGKDGE